jgi:hypothetical protein
MRSLFRWYYLSLTIAFVLSAPVWGASKAAGTSRGSERYAYGSVRFSRLVADSFQSDQTADAKEFYNWMSRAYSNSSARFPGKEDMSLDQLLTSKRTYFGEIKDQSVRMRNEMAMSAWLHKLVKNIIPKFSLDRGFEFTSVIKTGERQCFLQSVLIAGMLQKMGIDAGVAMVYKNITGQETNNGHAVTLVKLANGQDIMVDASEPRPFARHQGLFVRTLDYEYVIPAFAKHSHRIPYYRPQSGGAQLAVQRVRTLDYDFIRSQFYYYRGERAIGGILASNPTREGLAASEKQLETSVRLCPKNPLAVYMLGRTYLLESKDGQARRSIHDANALYARFGWVPSGPREYLALVDRGKTSSSNASDVP